MFDIEGRECQNSSMGISEQTRAQGKLIFVDNDPSIRTLVTQAMNEISDIQVIALSTAKEAMDSLRQLKGSGRIANVGVLCDLMFNSQETGVDLLRFIRQDPELNNIKRGVFTASIDEHLKKTCLSLGVKPEHYIEKPGELDQVVKTVNDLVS